MTRPAGTLSNAPLSGSRDPSVPRAVPARVPSQPGSPRRLVGLAFAISLAAAAMACHRPDAGPTPTDPSPDRAVSRLPRLFPCDPPLSTAWDRERSARRAERETHASSRVEVTTRVVGRVDDACRITWDWTDVPDTLERTPQSLSWRPVDAWVRLVPPEPGSTWRISVEPEGDDCLRITADAPPYPDAPPNPDDTPDPDAGPRSSRFAWTFCDDRGLVRRTHRATFDDGHRQAEWRRRDPPEETRDERAHPGAAAAATDRSTPADESPRSPQPPEPGDEADEAPTPAASIPNEGSDGSSAGAPR